MDQNDVASVAEIMRHYVVWVYTYVRFPRLRAIPIPQWLKLSPNENRIISAIRLVHLWRSSRHSRLPHGREQQSIELPPLPVGRMYSPLKPGLEYI